MKSARGRLFMGLMIADHRFAVSWPVGRTGSDLEAVHQVPQAPGLGFQPPQARRVAWRFSTPSWLRVLISVMSMFSESTTAVCSSVAVATDWFMLSISPIRLVTLPRRSPARLAISTLSRL